MSVRQIAEVLKLSPSAVSLALRNSPKIPEHTKARVIREAQRIGYRPSPRVRELMSHVRLAGARGLQACLGVISLYDEARPWEYSRHLREIYANMEKRAAELGYRLEPFWLRAPGMTPRRIRSILDTRGIRGLLCFGSPNLAETFPEELDHYAIATIGLSIATPLHRVTSHFYNDLYHLLSKLRSFGYRRPGLVLGNYEDHRSAHAYVSAYLGWCEHIYGNPSLVPVLRLDRVEEKPLLEWLRNSAPDVVVFVHLYDAVNDLETVMRKNRIRVPEDLGVAVVTQILEGGRFSGMQQNQALMGAWAVELVVSRIVNQDFGIPVNPRTEMVESRWFDGGSLKTADQGLFANP